MSVDDGLRSIFRTRLRLADSTSVETGATALGVPDWNACLDGTEVWVEMKATSAWSISVRAEQIGWIERRTRHGGRVFLAVRRRHEGGPKKGPAVDELWLYTGSSTRHVAEHGLLRIPPLLRQSGGPSRWDWRQVSHCLFSLPLTPQRSAPLEERDAR